MKTNHFLYLIFASALFLGCSKGSVSGGGSSSLVGSLSIRLVYPSNEGESWTPIKSGARFYIKGLSVSIKGDCTRGIATVKVGESGSGGPFYSEYADCLNDGSFTWNKTFTGPLDVDKTLTLVPFDTNDLALTVTAANVDVHVDNVAPNLLVITTPASSPYTHNGAATTFAISGTCSGDTVRITGPGAAVTPSAGTWSDTVTLIDGALTNYAYYAWDLAGNQSSDTTQTIVWNPTIDLLVANVISGAPVTDGGTSFVLEGSSQSWSGTLSGGASLFDLETGFNFITQSARQ